MPQEDNFIPNTDYKNPSGESYPVGVNGRIDFSKISGNLALPNLVEIQTDSYQQFLEKGIDEVLAEAEKKKITITDDEREKTIDNLRFMLKALIANNVWDRSEYMQLINERSELVRAAMDHLKKQ